jgi:2-dehydro-3-deoxyglucarate aldolase
MAMSMSDGEPLRKRPERLEAAIDRTLEACLDAGVPVGRIRNSVEEARAARDAGYQLIRVGGDLGSMRATLGDRLDGLTE